MQLPGNSVGLLFWIASAFVGALVMTRAVLAFAQRRGILARTNHRSLHKGAMPVGGGLAIIVVALGLWCLTRWPLATAELILFSAALGLALVSWLDDLYSVPALLRLFAQIAAVAAMLAVIPAGTSVFPLSLPVWADRALAGLCWLWFINLYNFMDGIDGLAAVETTSIALGLLLAGGVVGLGGEKIMLAGLLAGAALGFLVWNWHPAKIFMGDVGAIPIGFLLGWLLIGLAARGHLLAALLLPLYFLADASLTLVRRLFKRQVIWRAHRSHYYQKAVLGGLTQDRVALRVVFANILLVGAALLSLRSPPTGALIAIAVVAALLVHLASQGRTK